MIDTDRRIIVGKNAPPIGETPSIILANVKYAHNVGMILRLASCYGFKQVWYTGDRIEDGMVGKNGKKRIPREERFRGYADVQLIQYDYPFDMFPNATPVAIEVRDNSEMLTEFVHPENPVYVFGAEDGAIQKSFVQHCHRFVIIPTRHCLNISTAVATILWDRQYKRYLNGEDVTDTPGAFEARGFHE